MRGLMKRPLFWPCVTLLLLIGLNAAMNPGFLALSWRDGHLYGNLIDILNRAAPLALVSAGMTLVIAAASLAQASAPILRHRPGQLLNG
jgi:simple sugar transport system permease protein